MRYVPSDKYNVAWFKLAECVSRGEKERALGVYRLLAHSLEDQAYARQLEGDIFLSCSDVQGAIERYTIALNHYQKTGRLLEAAAVGEQILILDPQRHDVLFMLIDLYGTLRYTVKVAQTIRLFLPHATLLDQLIKVANTLELVEQDLASQERGQLLEKIVFAFIKQQAPASVCMPYIKKTIDSCFHDDVGEKKLQQFLVELQELRSECYDQACAYIERDAE